MIKSPAHKQTHSQPRVLISLGHENVLTVSRLFHSTHYSAVKEQRKHYWSPSSSSLFFFFLLLVALIFLFQHFQRIEMKCRIQYTVSDLLCWSSCGMLSTTLFVLSTALDFVPSITKGFFLFFVFSFFFFSKGIYMRVRFKILHTDLFLIICSFLNVMYIF